VEPHLQVRPGRDEFDSLAAGWPLVPVWTELLADVSTPVGLFPAIAGDGPGLILESVERSERWGRYSFVAGDPAATVVVDGHGVRIEHIVRPLPTMTLSADADPREALIAIARSLAGPRLADLPPLIGGLMGYLAYEAAGLLDGHPAPEPHDAPCPPIGLLVIDRAVVFDHWRQRLILIAHVPAGGYDDGVRAVHDLAERIASAETPALAPSVSPQGSLDTGEANMPDEGYRWTVSAFKEHILAGDIYQGVPSRRVTFAAPDGGFPIYRRLRVTNPAPYMFFVRMLGMELAGSSPEPLVRVEGRRVSARPIAGTRPRGQTEIRDRLLEHELLADPKEQAEHAMLVDLARNDVGRVAEPGSVTVPILRSVERFSHVMHLVSEVHGRLRPDLDAFDALRAAFPAGTVSGAPKVRAMEAIAELEGERRGPYGGAIGFFSPGDLEAAITIRSAVIGPSVAHVHAGAGIVADSVPARESAEVAAKAAAMRAALSAGGAA